MNIIKSFVLAAAMAAGGLTHDIFAADHSAPAPVRSRMLQRLAEKLDLTDGPKSKIQAILIADRGTLATLLGQWHAARKNLRAAIHAADANETTVRAASARVAVSEADLAVERMKLYGKIAPVLTDAQRRQIADFEQRADGVMENIIGRIGGQPAE